MKTVRITEVCDFQGGTQPPKKVWIKEPHEGYIRMLQIRDFTQPEKNNIEYVPFKKSLKTCESDDILIGRYGASVGKILRGLSGAYNVAMVKTVPNESYLDKNYLWLILNSQIFQNFILNVGSRAAQAGFNKTDLEGFTFKLPPLDQQKRIAEILDTADAYRQKTIALLDKYDQLAQSIFLEMFGDPMHENKKDKRIDFKELTNRITYGFTKPMKHMDKGIHILTAKNVQNGYIDYDKVHFADLEEFNELTDKSKPEKNDILITKDGSIGRTALLDADFPVCINQSIALIKPKKEIVKPIYLVGYLISEPVQRRIQNMGKGGGLKHLQITELAKFPTILPDFKVQSEYEEKIRLIKHQKQIVQRSLNHAEDLYNSLLQKAFKGELTN